MLGGKNPDDMEIPQGDMLERLSGYFGRLIYLAIAVVLLVIGLSVIAFSLWEVGGSITGEASLIDTMLNAIGLTVLGLAVIDVSKYLLEEEVIRQRELRATREARGTITKFLIIITIAVNLEALVFIFQSGTTDVETLIYPTLLLVAGVLIVVGLGLYQWLSARIESRREE